MNGKPLTANHIREDGRHDIVELVKITSRVTHACALEDAIG
jgi:hypothetical protein